MLVVSLMLTAGRDAVDVCSLQPERTDARGFVFTGGQKRTPDGVRQEEAIVKQLQRRRPVWRWQPLGTTATHTGGDASQ